MYEGRAGMGDDLEAMLAADEAAIKDAGFAARVARNARTKTNIRRTWLTIAGALGAGVSVYSLFSLSRPIESAMESMAPAQFVVSLPVVDLSLQMQGESLVAIGLGLTVLLAIAAARFASDDL